MTAPAPDPPSASAANEPAERAALRLTPEERALVGRMAPYARAALNQAGNFALWLHATEVAPEHFLASLLADEECGATRLVLHAFADPETIGIEVTALCQGIMVVGSGRSLPFSVRGIAAAEAARALAAERREAAVEVAHLFQSALGQLGDEAQGALRAAGFESSSYELPAALPASEPVPAEGPLFRSFSNDARRALGGACRIASQLSRRSISPAHLLLACLEAAPEVRERAALTPTRARMALSGRDADATPSETANLPLSSRLGRALGELPEGAQTLDFLGQVLARGSEELRALLRRQKVTTELWESVQSARSRFEDPS